MANVEEQLVLNERPRDMDKCLQAVVMIESYVIKRLIQGYKDKSENVPKVLLNKKSEFRINSLDSHVSKTRLLPSRKPSTLTLTLSNPNPHPSNPNPP